MILDKNMRFTKVISLGRYDGTTGGLAEVLDSSGGVAWCRYELVAWDHGQDSRVFCLGSIREGVFDALGALLSRTEVPRWPLWFPHFTATDVNPETNQWEDGAEDFTGVFVSDGYLRSITAVRSMTSEMKARIPKRLPNCSDKDFQMWLSLVSGH